MALMTISDTPLGVAYDVAGQFVAMSDAQRLHCTLWAASTYVYRLFPAFGRLDFAAVGPGCGKSTALEVFTAFCPEPLTVGHSTQSSLKNWVDEYPNTTLGIDERDTIFGTTGRGAKSAKELSSMLNAGYAANGKMLATRNGRAVRIPVYNAVALAGIGRTYDALLDRSITIQLEKRMPAEVWVSVLYEKQMHAIGKDIKEWLSGRSEREFLAGQPYMADIPGDPRHKLIMAPMAAIAALAGLSDEFRDAENEIVTGMSSAPVLTRGQMLARDLAHVWPVAQERATADDIRAMLPDWPIAPGRVGDVFLASLMRTVGAETQASNGVRAYLRSDVLADTDSEHTETAHRTQHTENLRSADAAEAFRLLEN